MTNATAETERAWKVIGFRRGRSQIVRLFAWDYFDAVRKTSRGPHMLVVRECRLDEPEDREALRAQCIALARRLPTRT